MTLQQTVSKILKKPVTAKRAQLFANEEYGVLAAYIRAECVAEILDFRAKNKETKEYECLNTVFNSVDKDKHYFEQKKLNNIKRKKTWKKQDYSQQNK